MLRVYHFCCGFRFFFVAGELTGGPAGGAASGAGVGPALEVNEWMCCFPSLLCAFPVQRKPRRM